MAVTANSPKMVSRSIMSWHEVASLTLFNHETCERHEDFGLQILIPNQLNAQFLNLFPHSRADERVEFMLEFVEREVRVKFGIAFRQFRQKLKNILFIYTTV